MEENIVGPRPNWVPTGRGELKFGLGAVLAGLFLGFAVGRGGWNLGWALGQTAALALTWCYLRRLGHKGDGYSNGLLALCLVITAGFGWSADGAVKAVMVPFLLVGINLALCRMAGKQRHSTGSARSLADALGTFNDFGFRRMGMALRGVGVYLRSRNSWAQNSGAVLVGIGIAAPLLLVVVPLLMSADAAFAGLVELIPPLDFQLVTDGMLGTVTALFLYSRGVNLGRGEPEDRKAQPSAGIHAWTVNTALGAVCAVYLVYLFSQLAYFVGGFAGILPAGYTAAEYARRGFFEMTWLCAINLGLMAFGMGRVSRSDRAPAATRVLCLFLALVSEFLVAASVAKMLLYIGSFGLTRLRVLTMVAMVFLGVTTAAAAVWIFRPRLQYMKIAMLLGLSLGAGLLWLDVDTQVANYNVDAYLSGRLSQVDVDYLGELGPGAADALLRLDEADEGRYDRQIRWALQSVLRWNSPEAWTGINGISWRSSRKAQAQRPELQVYQEVLRNWVAMETVAEAVLEAGAVTGDTQLPGYTLVLHRKEDRSAVEFRPLEGGEGCGVCYYPDYDPFNVFSDLPLNLGERYFYCYAGTRRICMENLRSALYWYWTE